MENVGINSVENQASVQELESKPTVNLEENYSKLQGDYDMIKAQYEADKVRFETERFASPLVKRIDEMVRNEAPLNQISKFISLQSLDLEKMSSEEKIKQRLSMEKPSFSPKEIDALFRRDFPALDEEAGDDERELREITLKEKALEAQAFLEDQLAQAQDTKAIEAKAKREAEQKAAITRYETVASNLMKGLDKVTVGLDADEFKYGFDFPIPKNEDVNKGILSLAVSEAMKQGIPVSDSERIKSIIQETTEMVYHRQIREAMIRDNWANSKRQAVVANSNPAPLPSGSGAPKNTPPPKAESGPKKVKGSTFY